MAFVSIKCWHEMPEVEEFQKEQKKTVDDFALHRSFF